MRTLISAIAALIVLASPAFAFDCGKAATAVEKAICADRHLLEADAAMSRAYAEVRELSTASERKILARAQREWIAERESKCARDKPAEVAACVKEETEQRLALLAGTPDSGPGTGSRMIPVFVKQAGDAKTYTVDAMLLRFAKPSSAGEKRFNDWIKDIAAKLPLGPQEEESDTGRSATAIVSLSHLSNELLSAYVLYVYYDGGAHPSHHGENINIDMQAGRELSIADILSEEAAATIAAQCYDQIAAEKKERIGEADYKSEEDTFLSKDVIGEHVATLSRWSFTSEKADLHFDEYAIGPYAEGAYDCTFPMAEFRKLALPDAPLPE
jgi:uncharacterized protein